MGNSDHYKKCREISCKLKSNSILSGVKYVQQEKLKWNTLTFLHWQSQYFYHNTICNFFLFLFSPFRLCSPTLPGGKALLLKGCNLIFKRNQLSHIRFRIQCSNQIIQMLKFFAHWTCNTVFLCLIYHFVFCIGIHERVTNNIHTLNIYTL